MISVSDVENLHLLEQDQKLFRYVCPKTLAVEVGDDFPLARNMTLA